MTICARNPFDCRGGSRLLVGGYSYWPLWFYGQRNELPDVSGHGVTLYPSGAYFDGQGYYFDGSDDYLIDDGGRYIFNAGTAGSWHSIYLTNDEVPAEGNIQGTGTQIRLNHSGASPKVTGNFILRPEYCPNLKILYCNYNLFSNFDVSEIVTLTHLSCSYSVLTTLDIPNLSLLERLWCIESSLVYVDVSGKRHLHYLRLSDNFLSQEMVDTVLCDMVDNGCTYGSLYLEINHNTAPSATGEACKGILVDRGWTVVTD